VLAAAGAIVVMSETARARLVAGYDVPVRASAVDGRPEPGSPVRGQSPRSRS
jgi:hypothetical protein